MKTLIENIEDRESEAELNMVISILPKLLIILFTKLTYRYRRKNK